LCHAKHVLTDGQRTAGWLVGQPENIMAPPTIVGEGIRYAWLFSSQKNRVSKAK